MMRILVTGGAGFIVSNFVRMALRDELPELAGVEITVLDALTYCSVGDQSSEQSDGWRMLA